MATVDYEYIGSLVEQIQKGNIDAFSEFYAATCKKQYEFAYNYIKDEFLAQDAVQETYISALKNIHVLKEPTLAVAWLNQINFRVCYQMQRRKNRMATASSMGENGENLFEMIEDPDGSAEDRVVNVENKKYMVNQILNLPFTESQCILLKYYQDKSTKEIAELLDISRSSVKRYTAKALSRLKNILMEG